MMISIPIWVFVILVTLSSILTLIVGISIISYVNYCSIKNKEIKRRIEEKYGTKEENK